MKHQLAILVMSVLVLISSMIVFIGQYQVQEESMRINREILGTIKQ